METFIAALLVIAMDNQEFMEMAEERQNAGHEWHYVGRTEVTDEYIALPAVEELTGTEVFYWEIKEPLSEN